MKKPVPFLWFNNQAEDAARFYAKVFKGSKVGAISRYGEAGPGPKGSVMTVQFRVNGQDFIGLNGGPHFSFTEAVSFVVYCDTQKEIDRLWSALTRGGVPSQCGWLKDRFGLSWQLVPTILPKLMLDKDAARRDRVMTAVLGMSKLEIAALKRAAAAKASTTSKRSKA